MLKLSFDPKDEAQEADPDESAQLLALLARFFSWRAIPPSSLPALADQLAPLCAVLRDAVRAQLGDRTSEVAKAAAEFEGALFPDRTRDEIADAFAQVCTYSMLLARASGAEALDAPTVEAALTHGHPVLGRIVRVLLDDQTERELGWALETVRTLVEAIDFDRLRASQSLPGMTHHDQTWLYFYETFLARYDPRLRDQYGVYYTPQQVIGAQVRLIEEVLRTRLGLSLGLASPEVTVLDPAVGTGSYPTHVVLSAAETARERLGDAAVPGVVRGLAENLQAFEVLAGPYAVAHLRLSEVLESLDAGVAGEAVNVYLTDTLSSPYVDPGELTRLLEPLVDEQRKALRVKSEMRVLVCLGNPPYERGRRRAEDSGAVEGGWVVLGEGGGGRAIFEDFLDPVREAGLGGHAKNLYNDYIYFWRWALWKVFERPDAAGFSNEPGVVSFITASSYLAGPAYGGVRRHLRRACDELLILDLGGEGRGARREENVFAIQTPVAIAIGVRNGAAKPDTPATVRYARIAGDRGQKLAALAGIRSLEDLDWEECPNGWQDPLLPAASGGWKEMPRVVEVFPWQHSGVQVKRTWPISATDHMLRARWNELLAAPDRGAAMRETGARNLTARPVALTEPERAPSIGELEAGSPAPPILRYGYRPFDRQWLIADSRLIDRPRPELWQSLSERQIFMVSFLTGVLGPGPAAVATALVPDLDHFRGSFGGRHVVPLYRDAAGAPNLDPGVLERLRTELGLELEAEDVFAYAYCLLSSPRYVERYFDELRQPGPRLPITASAEHFEYAADLGRWLLWLHTYGQRMTGPDRPRGDVSLGSARIVEEIAGRPEESRYDSDALILLVGTGAVGPVTNETWEWSVSGYRVVYGWLRQRMAEAAGRARSSGSTLDAIRPSAWPARYTTELLELLWLLEATIGRAQEQSDLLDAICEGPLVRFRPRA